MKSRLAHIVHFLKACLSAPLRPDPHLFLGNQVSAYGKERKEMWTKAHRARHEARLKEIVAVSAVGEIARWAACAKPKLRFGEGRLEHADPPRSDRKPPGRAA